MLSIRNSYRVIWVKGIQKMGVTAGLRFYNIGKTTCYKWLGKYNSLAVVRSCICFLHHAIPGTSVPIQR